MRERSTWTQTKLAQELRKLAEDPRSMNQDHIQQQPAHDKYVTGDPSTFGEDISPSAGGWKAEQDGSGNTKRNEIGMPEMRGDTFNHPEKSPGSSPARQAARAKAALAASIAERLLPKKASMQEVEAKAFELMGFSTADLIESHARLAQVDEEESDEDDSKQAADQDDEESDDDSKQAADQDDSDDEEDKKAKYAAKVKAKTKKAKAVKAAQDEESEEEEATPKQAALKFAEDMDEEESDEDDSKQAADQDDEESDDDSKQAADQDDSDDEEEPAQKQATKKSKSKKAQAQDQEEESDEDDSKQAADQDDSDDEEAQAKQARVKVLTDRFQRAVKANDSVAQAKAIKAMSEIMQNGQQVQQQYAEPSQEQQEDELMAQLFQDSDGLEMNSPYMDEVSPDPMLTELFANTREAKRAQDAIDFANGMTEVDLPAQRMATSSRTASTQTVGTKPKGVSQLGGVTRDKTASADSDAALASIWKSAPDVSHHFS